MIFIEEGKRKESLSESKQSKHAAVLQGYGGASLEAIF